MSGANRGDPERVKRIVVTAIALPAAEREGYIAAECAGDAGLEREVRSLVAAHDAAGSFMGSPTAAHDAGATAAAPAREGPGSRIGAYRLLELIGEGGFGSVYMAEQREPIARRVALKIIKPGMDSRMVAARFEAERQALALMEHPHIARVFDAGVTDVSQGSRPYFVMEYVKGDPITAFADAHKLSLAERLGLFAQVCEAVQHAHTKGVIHRDLKPGNVLVSMTDGRPFAKVIDFGIAKATGAAGGRLTDKTLFTEHRQLIGTPEYMSPEQAEGSPDIDTRTDVYALGVLLYELLTGSTPFDAARLRSAAFAEMQRIIKEEDPPLPSVKLSRNLKSLAAAAAARKAEPGRLGGQVRGELDWIVMKALEKDRGRRYESASGLAADVRRHLAGEAVVAAPPSAGYRVRKFVRRNKGAVMAGGAVVGVLVVGLAGTAWQWRRAEAANAELAEQVRRARLAEARIVVESFEARDEGGTDNAILPVLSLKDAVAARTEYLGRVHADTIRAEMALVRENQPETGASLEQLEEWDRRRRDAGELVGVIDLELWAKSASALWEKGEIGRCVDQRRRVGEHLEAVCERELPAWVETPSYLHPARFDWIDTGQADRIRDCAAALRRTTEASLHRMIALSGEDHSERVAAAARAGALDSEAGIGAHPGTIAVRAVLRSLEGDAEADRMLREAVELLARAPWASDTEARKLVEIAADRVRSAVSSEEQLAGARIKLRLAEASAAHIRWERESDMGVDDPRRALAEMLNVLSTREELLGRGDAETVDAAITLARLPVDPREVLERVLPIQGAWDAATPEPTSRSIRLWATLGRIGAGAHDFALAERFYRRVGGALIGVADREGDQVWQDAHASYVQGQWSEEDKTDRDRVVRQARVLASADRDAIRQAVIRETLSLLVARSLRLVPDAKDSPYVPYWTASLRRGAELVESSGAEDHAAQWGLGVARYRLGEFDAAHAYLTRAAEIQAASGGTADPAGAAFMAMARCRIGDRDGAESALREMESLMADDRWANEWIYRSLADEARELIRREGRP